MSEVVEVKKTKRAPVPMSRISLRPHCNQDWTVTAEPGTTLEEVLQPDYWAFSANNMRPADDIRVVAEDGSWLADLVVIDCTRVSANVVVKFHFERQEEAQQVVDNWEVKWRGPHRKWSVVDRATKQVQRDGFETQGDAAVYAAKLK